MGVRPTPPSTELVHEFVGQVIGQILIKVWIFSIELR